MSIRSVCCIAVALCARTSFAQEMPRLTLSQALEEARQHEPSLRAALAELKARRAEAGVPRALWMPRIGGTAQLFGATNNSTTGVYLNVDDVDIPRTGSSGGHTQATATWRPDVSTLAAVSVSQEVYDFGRISARIAVADAAARGASADAETALLDVLLNADEAFHSVLAANAVLSATLDAKKRAETHRDYARATTKSGLRPPIDLTRAQADVARFEVQRVRAEGGLTVAQANLAAAIGSDARQVDAIAEPLDASPSPTLDEAVRLAAAHNPSLYGARARLDAQRATTRVITHGMLPDLSATAGLNGRAGGLTPPGPPYADPGAATVPYGSGWLPDVVNWHLGLVFAWNIFDGTVLAQRRVSRAREEKAQAQLDVAKLAVAFGAERAWVNLDSALKTLPQLRESLGAAQANQAQADARFKAGLGNVVELADAEAILINAQVDLAVGEFDVARARAQLGRALGGDGKTP